jgi:hypothetical protein
MHRSMRSLFLALVACSWPLAMAAYAQTDAAPSLTVEQTRDAFVAAGYQVDTATTWDWTSPPVTSFTVHDQNGGRVVMVLVYPGAAAAELARSEAALQDQHLVVGYGPGAWNGNVALVQSTETQLQRAYQAQADRDNGVYVDPQTVVQDPQVPSIAVDPDFLQALSNGAANL